MKKTKVKWSRVIGLLTIVFMIWTTYDILTAEPQIKTTPVGEYQCSGHFIKICSGSEEVANYLGN